MEGSAAPDESATPITARLRDGSAAGTWKLDPSRSSVEFAVKHFWGMTTVKGVLTRFEGQATVETSGGISGTMTIDADSVDTKNAKRDAHLRSADFFDVANHPTITFSSRDVTPQVDDRFRVTGDLTAAGQTHPAEFGVRITPLTRDRATAEGEITMDRPVRNDLEPDEDRLANGGRDRARGAREGAARTSVTTGGSPRGSSRCGAVRPG